MWAMIPMFRVLASGTWRVIARTVPGLPLEMAEGLVGLGHLVGVLAALDGGAEAVHRVHELGGELLGHALAAPLARGLDEPADAERQAAIAPDLDRDLVGCAADAARLDLDDRRRVAEGRLHDLETRPARGCLGAGERLAQDARGQAALAVGHELRLEALRRAVDGLLLVFGLPGDPGAARHLGPSADRRRGLGAVLAATLLAVPHAGSVEGAADDVVLDRGQVLDPATPNEDDGVLLEVVADARDVGRDL